MDFSTIATTWAGLTKASRIVILTEPERLLIADRIKADNLPHVADVMIMDITSDAPYEAEMSRMAADDLLIALLTVDGFKNRGFRNRFPPFTKPTGYIGKYIFIRLDIPQASLLAGLHTDIGKVESIIDEYRALESGKRARITTDKGTDVVAQVARQELLPYDARLPGGNAFLPPTEILEELTHAATNGVIVVDVTVGELRFGLDLIDPLGVVDSDVTVTVENGLVELGHGLSDGVPTGIIGVDESMNGTCHFGIGNHNPYHVDVVIADPCIVVVDS